MPNWWFAGFERNRGAVFAIPGDELAPPQGRLTLQTLTPVMTTTQSAKTTIYYTPYQGNLVPIYNGTTFSMVAFSELSVLTTDTLKSPAAIGANKVNDWFVWNDAGTLRIGHGPDWTSDTARSAGTALVRVNGLWLNNASITNGPAAQRGTYVGTTRSNASSQLDWIFATISNPPTPSAFNLWNAYNRCRVTALVGTTSTDWTYGSSTPRESNDHTGTFRHNFVIGLAEDGFMATNIQMAARQSGGDAPYVGLGYDTNTAFTSGPNGTMSLGGAVSANSITAIYQTIPAIGYHFICAMEAAGPSVPPSFYGGAGPGNYQTGLFFDFRM